MQHGLLSVSVGLILSAYALFKRPPYAAGVDAEVSAGEQWEQQR